MGSDKIKSGYRSAFAAVIFQVIIVLGTSSVVRIAFNFSTIARLFGNCSADIFSEYSMLINAVVYIIADLVPVLYFMNVSKNKGSVRNWFANSKLSGLQTVLLGLSTLAVGLVVSRLLGIVKSFLGINGTSSIGSNINFDNKIVFAISLLYICVIGPLLEEVLFRGFVLHETSCVNPVFGILVSATLFGLFHLNIEKAVSATIIGILFGYIALKANSIKPTIVLHMIYNSFIYGWKICNCKFEMNPSVVLTLIEGIILSGMIVLMFFIISQGRIVRSEDVLDSDIYICDADIKRIKEKEKRNSLGCRLALSQVSFYCVYIVLFVVSLVVQSGLF